MSESTKVKKSSKKAAEAPVVQEQEVVRKLPSSVSYSKLTTYDRCSELFRLKYVQGIPESREDTVATRLGGLCHEALEAFYEDGGETISGPYEALVMDGGIWDQEMTRSNLMVLKRDLQTYGHHMTKLYHRASAGYTGTDKIRKADGTVSVAPQMTGAWKQYVKAHALDRLAANIDQVAARACPNRWAGISFAEVYAGSLGMLFSYTNPPEISAVVAIELPISEIKLWAANPDGTPMVDGEGNPVPTSRSRGPHPVFVEPGSTRGRLLEIQHEFYLPKLGPDGKLLKDEQGNLVFRDDILFNGYIDMLARDTQGRLYIIDHKTSKEQYTEVKVGRHEQLLAYGLMVEELTGEKVYRIGINALRRNELVTAVFDRERAELAMARLASIVAATEAGIFVKKDPDAYMTMCVIKSFKDGEPPTLCPGLKYCHPEVYAFHTRALDF